MGAARSLSGVDRPGLRCAGLGVAGGLCRWVGGVRGGTALAPAAAASGTGLSALGRLVQTVGLQRHPASAVQWAPAAVHTHLRQLPTWQRHPLTVVALEAGTGCETLAGSRMGAELLPRSSNTVGSRLGSGSEDLLRQLGQTRPDDWRAHCCRQLQQNVWPQGRTLGCRV